jgi:hypothetical protein
MGKKHHGSPTSVSSASTILDGARTAGETSTRILGGAEDFGAEYQMGAYENDHGDGSLRETFLRFAEQGAHETLATLSETAEVKIVGRWWRQWIRWMLSNWTTFVYPCC